MGRFASFFARVLLAAAVISILTEAVRAHPHVLPSVRTGLVFSLDRRLAAIHHTWTYDIAYSTFAIRNIDANKDGAISRDELAAFAKSQLDAFAEHNYFTTVTMPAGEYELGTVESFSIVRLDDGRLQLDFKILLTTSGDFHKKLVIEIYDPNFFAYFTMTASDVRLVGAPQGCAPTVAGPQPVDLKNTRSIPDVFWQALRGSKTAGLQLVNRITLKCP